MKRNALKRDHWRAIRTSSMLTRWFRAQFQKSLRKATPEKVISLLKANNIRYVLIGVVGMSGWRSRPRASQDVDILVANSNLKRTTNIIKEAFPKLIQDGHRSRSIFLWPKNLDEVIDIWTPDAPLLEEAVATSLSIKEDVRIPALEVSLAMKYASGLAPLRKMAKRYQDAADLADIFIENDEEIDIALLQKYGDLVRPLGGQRLIRWLRNIKKGTGKLRLPN